MVEETTPDYGPVKIILHSKTLKSTSLFGSGSFSASSLAEDVLELKVHGSSNVKLAGKVTKLSILLYGSANVSAEDLTAQNADVKIYGSGDVKLTVTDNLSAKIYGSGSLTYSGTAKVDQQVFGSGSVQKK